MSTRPIQAQRVAGFTASIFGEMSLLAQRHQAINLGQGFPDFPGPDLIKDAASAAIAANLNQYPPSPGVPRLRQALAAQWTREHGRPVYAERRDLLRALLEQAGLPPLPVEGAYFISCDVGHLGYTDDVTFCRRLIADVGVAAIPTSIFYTDPASAPAIARFCFAKQHATLAAAGERLRRVPELLGHQLTRT